MHNHENRRIVVIILVTITRILIIRTTVDMSPDKPRSFGIHAKSAQGAQWESP